MQSLRIDKLNGISLADKELFQGFFKISNMQCCEFNFPNLFNWNDVYEIKWAVYNERLILYNATEDIILMPQGKAISPEELFGISKLFIEQGKSGRIDQVDENYVSAHPGTAEFFKIDYNDDTGEYIYLTEKLCSLSGPKLHKKKNLISQFLRNNPDHEVFPIDREILKSCVAFNSKWYIEKNDDDHALEEEKIAMNSAFANYFELGLEGIAVYVQGEMAAFSIFSRQNSDTYTVHFEKAERNVKGSAQVINWETAKYLKDKCRYINREQDLGEPGLRQAKLSYCPEYLLKNYSLAGKC